MARRARGRRLVVSLGRVVVGVLGAAVRIGLSGRLVAVGIGAVGDPVTIGVGVVVVVVVAAGRVVGALRDHGFARMAKRLNKRQAKVLIKVLIDENGKVVKAELAGKKQGFGFDEEALSAAKKSVYNPATKDGIPVKYWHTLAVEFRDR